MFRSFAFVAGAFAILVGTGCGSTPGTTATDISAAGQAVLQRGDFERSLLLTGELQAVHSISIKAPQTSIFQMRIQFMAEEGSVVSAGDTLLEFDNSSLTDQVRELETQILDAETQIVSKRSELASALKDLEIELAERRYDRDMAALDAGVDAEVLSRKEYAERQVALDKAERELVETNDRIELTRSRGQAELDVLIINRDKLQKDMLKAEQDRDRMTVLAPSDGLVVYERRQGTTLRYQEGDSCWPSQGVMRLPDLSAMQVEFSVNEVDAPLLETGMPIRITVDAFPGRELRGEIAHIPSMAVKRDEQSKVAVFKVRASLDETWVGEMKPGMSALGKLIVERRENAPLVARHAVEFDGSSYHILRDGSVESAPIAIEPVDRNERFYVVTEETYAELSELSAEVLTAGVGGTP